MEIDVGRVIGGKYRLVRLLGRGSMGEVWAAHHQSLQEHVALKLLTHDPEGEDVLEAPHTANARFQFEAQVAARLSRKTRHIVRVTDHGQDDGVAYIVMELLDGETLEALLLRERANRLPLPLVVDLVHQISRALATAHKEGVAHRDLKPANVFLTRDEDGRMVAKLLDFGIARALHAHRVRGAFSTEKGLIFGTPSYMSPEQARGAAGLDHRCDLWALATIAYEALTTKFPVEGQDNDDLLKNLCGGRIFPIGQRDPALAEAFGPFFARAFDDMVGARFQSAPELATAFARAAGVPTDREVSAPTGVEAAPPVSVTPARLGAAGSESAPRVPGPRRAAMIAAGVAVVAVAAIAIAWRALAPSSTAAGAGPSPPSSLATGTVASTLPSSRSPVTPSTTLAPLPSLGAPAVPVSALPRVTPAAPVPLPGGHPTVPAPASAPSPPPAAPPPPPPPPPAPAPTKKDRSEVF